MFKVSDGNALQKEVMAAESNYIIQKNDFLELQVFTNGGERIIDPDFQLQKDITNGGLNAARPQVLYLVDIEGNAKLPMVGTLKLEGLTLRQAEQILQKEYGKFYTEPFVILKYGNKRIVVLGAPGGQLIPLINENVTLTEILAMANGVGPDAKAHNIRVIRGDSVFVVDFSTFESFRKGNMIMQPGDVVYVEPIRRVLPEAVRDYGPILSLATSLTTLLIVLISL